jgi:hypothetical protein
MNRAIQGSEALRRTLGLATIQISLRIKDLTVQIAPRYPVAIHYRERTYARCRQIIEQRRPETSCAQHQHAGAGKLYLALFTHQRRLPRVALVTIYHILSSLRSRKNF